jgi:hypothetical protein
MRRRRSVRLSAGRSGVSMSTRRGKRSRRISLSGWMGFGSRRRRWRPTRKNVRLHIAPYIGSVPLVSLTPARIDALYCKLEREGRVSRRTKDDPVPRLGLSARTVRYIHTILQATLKAAVEANRLERNPAAKAHPPSAKARTIAEHGRDDPIGMMSHATTARTQCAATLGQIPLLT